MGMERFSRFESPNHELFSRHLESVSQTWKAFFQVSFLIPPEAVPGRLGLLVTLFLCSVNTLNTVSTNSPRPDDGASALVMWILMCLTAILLAMFEYALILALKMKRQRMKVTPGEQTKSRTAFKMDIASLVVIPSGFTFLSFMFWVHARD